MKRAFYGIVLVGLVLLVGGLAWALRYPELEPIDPPDPQALDSQLVAKGRELAGFGDCAVCHTGRSGNEFAGGLPLQTPFGVLYSTNITPDLETGIGNWSEAAFVRALREGVDREGNYLYPAFPYDHFTKVTDEDLHALYAYIMTVEAFNYVPPDNELPFPFNIRLSLAGWNLLFLRQGIWEPDPAMDDEWNRGAYLVEGLGHCGSCHTPRNLLGAEKTGQAYGGGVAEGWHAPALNNDSPAVVPWTQDTLVNYILDGWDRDHGVSAGPMTPVVNHLYQQSEDDSFAIAAYIHSLRDLIPSEEETAQRVAFANEREWNTDEPPSYEDPALQRGVVVFKDLCAKCHRIGGTTVPLALTTTVNGPDARNVMHIIFDGVRPARGALDHSMPNFGVSLTEQDVVDVLNFVREHFTDLPPWQHIEKYVAEKLESY